MNYFTFVKNNWSSLGFPNYKSGVSAQKMKDAYKAAKGTSTPAKPSKKKNKKDDVKTENKTESTATTLKHMDVLLEKMQSQQAALKKMAPITVPKIVPKPIKNGYAFGTPQPVIVPKKKKEYLPVKYKSPHMSSKYDNVQRDIDKFNKKKNKFNTSYMSHKYDDVQRDIDKFNKKKNKFNSSYMSHRYDYVKEHIDKYNQKKADPLYQFAG